MEAEATRGSSNNELEVELKDPYEPEFLVGVPFDSNKTAGGVDNDPQDRPNPWVEAPPKVDRRIIAKLQQQQPLANDFHEAQLSLANPINYTPCHPSRIPKPSLFKRATARARTKPSVPHLEAKTEPAMIEPAHSSSSQSNAQCRPSNPTTILQPPILKPPTTSHAQLNQSNMPPASQSGLGLHLSKPQPYQPRFAGAPNFTRFSNGSPQVQVVNSFNQQYNLGLNHRPPNLAPPAHSGQSIINNPTIPNIIRPAAAVNAPLHQQSLQATMIPPPTYGAFSSQAQPVNTAMTDFLKYFSDLTGFDYNSLLGNMDNNGPNNSIRLHVPANDNVNITQEQVDQFVMAYNQQIQHQQQQQLLQQQLQQLHRSRLQYRTPQVQQSQIPKQHPTTAASSLNNLAPNNVRPQVPTADEMVLQDIHVDADGDEEYHEVETYADYEPAKLKLGKTHPDPVVETSSLSTVEPPDIDYTLKLPAKVIDGALLSSLQLESVIYACQQHAQLMPDRKTRRGFLIGDGAGVGKGRTIAGIIYENYLCGRKKSIWLSVSTDLKLDAERDLRDIGAKIPVFLLNKFQYGRRINEDNGVIFTTYSGLVSKSQSVRGIYGSRLAQLVAWAGTSFDGVIVFDECHKAKNISLKGKKTTKKLSKAAEYVLEIQEKLPNARIVYASATGASETRHLGYMTRLGIWGPGTPYESFSVFCETIERRGVGAMELVAVELKMRGSYIARQLSFKTTSFSIERAHLNDEFIALYDQCVDMWALALKHFREAESFFSKKELKSMWPSFWAAHQKFFKYLCISVKVPVVIDIVEKALAEGKCAVIGLQSTGEAKTLEAMEDGDINEFISTARATFESLIENHFPAPSRGRRRRRASASTDSDLPPYLPGIPSDKSSSTTSSSTIVDEQWISNDACKFVIQDGVALPKITEHGSSSRSRKNNSKPVDAKQQALFELVQAKRAATKSARTLRHKRRLAIRQTDKSRIKKVSNTDSDTEISDPLSDSGGHLLSDSSLSDSDYEADTVTEFDGSDDELVVVGTKSGRPARRNLIDDDSDDDVQITAIKTPVKPTIRPEAKTIFINDDDDDEEDDPSMNDDGEDRGEERPMIKYAARLTRMQEELFAQIDALGPKLPNNTLDDLIDRLGGPTKVAEMTGRKGRVVKDSYGQISYRQRNEIDCSEALNIEEKRRFMDGEKYIAIISEAASSGISLQADKRVTNTRRRVHITIELPWSADRAVQQFGRTHRSNQLSGPEYVFIISDLAGETRFASIVAKRLESLGALTHGDRRASTEARDLSQFNIGSKYCRMALEHMNRLLETNIQFAEIRPDYKGGNFLEDARKAYLSAGLGHLGGDLFTPDPQSLNINLFLNRILGMKVRIQNAIFDLFTKITDRLITRKKVAGEYDAGILELNSASGKTRVDPPEDFLIRTNSGFVKCTLRNIRYERGIPWEEARDKLVEADGRDKRSGFYMATNSITKSKSVILAIREPGIDQFRIYKPNVGRQPKLEFYSQVIGKFDKVDENTAEKIWRFIYQATDNHCIHMCHFNSCKRIEARMKCDVGIRHRLFCILSGGILTIWPYLEAKVPEATRRIQIIRLRLDDNTRIIGPNIPQDCLDKVRKALRDGASTGIDFNARQR
uniref:Protein strawberry notch 1 n=1 Tax=Aceria tosichella TaxID=561515 RepID=A0A6G1SIS9_9ACAR